MKRKYFKFSACSAAAAAASEFFSSRLVYTKVKSAYRLLILVFRGCPFITHSQSYYILKVQDVNRLGPKLN